MPVSVISTGQLARPEVRIGHVTISRNSSWIHLDNCLRGLVKTYLACLDPDNSQTYNWKLSRQNGGDNKQKYFGFYLSGRLINISI